MAQLLAPYNNSMRLGQGFNSYSQQICLDRAVLEDTEDNRAQLDKKLRSSGDVRPSKAPKRGSADSAVAWTEPSYENTFESPNDRDFKDTEVKVIEKTKLNDENCMGSKEKTTPSSNKPPSWAKAQIVTYTSRFVDKLSDVTEAMNISGSLSIKTGIIGGQANGSYIDSDKFKSSDINLHLQVKVTNQTQDASKRFTIFNKLESVKNKDFSQIYGDTFISGWEEGGELNAIISMKVTDKSKIADIKADIDAEITQLSAVKTKGRASFGKGASNNQNFTETTIAVSWSGGGRIKQPEEEWSIPTLVKTAAAFPDLVAVTPQRTYAILTKYSALESYHSQMKHHRPLNYENAGIYTSALLDHYMDYKVLWKQISQATYELEAGRATIEKAQPSDDIFVHADIRTQPTQTEVELLNGHNTAELQPNGEPGTDTVPLTARDIAVTAQAPSGELTKDNIRYKIFNPSFAGLIEARKVCRFEMAKIVNEVDLIARHPTLAANPGRDRLFLNPVVFKQLLPIVRVASECSVICQGDPSADLLLGYSPPTEPKWQPVLVYKLEDSFGTHAVKIQKKLHEVRQKSRSYRVQGLAGEITNFHPSATTVNDLDSLESLDRPTKLEVWCASDVVQGIKLTYSNKKEKRHGACDGLPSHTMDLESKGSEAIYEVMVKTAVNERGIPVITQFSVATTHYKVLDTAQEPSFQPPKPTRDEDGKNAAGGESSSGQAESSQNGKDSNTGSTSTPEGRNLSNPRTFKWSRPDHNHHWNLRGFFSVTFEGRLITLGIVWGKDAFVPVPLSPMVWPLCNEFLGLGTALQNSIHSHSLPQPKNFSGKFLMGHSVSTTTTAGNSMDIPPVAFNALDDIGLTWRIKTMTFAAIKSRLVAIKVLYFTGVEIIHGAYLPGTEVWSCDVESNIIMVKITAGKANRSSVGCIGSLEFIRADERGLLPHWPLDVCTIRYIGNEAMSRSKDSSVVVEMAPTTAGVHWSVRGFYGETSGGVISRLGVIWGQE